MVKVKLSCAQRIKHYAMKAYGKWNLFMVWCLIKDKENFTSLASTSFNPYLFKQSRR
jgi:hypothetical protein